MKKSAQRDANTAHTLAVVRFGHRPPINTQTHRQDRLQYTARQLASTQCNYAHYIIYLLCMAAKGWIRTVNNNMPLPMPLASLNIISCKYENCQRLQFTTEFAKTQTKKTQKISYFTKIVLTLSKQSEAQQNMGAGYAFFAHQTS